jgi:hypothetical protein
MGRLINVLTEYQEQCLLVEYLEAKNLKFSKIAQETFTRSWGIKRKNKLSGLRKGVPDMLIIIPQKINMLPDSKKLLFIEMKRSKGGKISPEQSEWLLELNQVPGVIAKEARGYEEAKKIIESLL